MCPFGVPLAEQAHRITRMPVLVSCNIVCMNGIYYAFATAEFSRLDVHRNNFRRSTILSVNPGPYIRRGGSGVLSNPPFLSLMRCKRWKVGIQCCGNSNAHLRGDAYVQPVALFQQGTWSSQAFLSSGPGCTGPSTSDFHAGSRRHTCICSSWCLAEHADEPPFCVRAKITHMRLENLARIYIYIRYCRKKCQLYLVPKLALPCRRYLCSHNVSS